MKLTGNVRKADGNHNDAVHAKPSMFRKMLPLFAGIAIACSSATGGNGGAGANHDGQTITAIDATNSSGITGSQSDAKADTMTETAVDSALDVSVAELCSNTTIFKLQDQKVLSGNGATVSFVGIGKDSIGQGAVFGGIGNPNQTSNNAPIFRLSEPQEVIRYPNSVFACPIGTKPIANIPITIVVCSWQIATDKCAKSTDANGKPIQVGDQSCTVTIGTGKYKFVDLPDAVVCK